MDRENMSEEEKWAEIERLQEEEDRQSEILKELTGKGLYEVMVEPDEDGVVYIDSEDHDHPLVHDLYEEEPDRDTIGLFHPLNNGKSIYLPGK
ncbi:hypothetical protein QRD89_15620 [Halobacillus sp. ACCC02827]|uniref:hypothetical protein n=1 Tax=Bacillaceae TaxID=186817 RepID=UPI0002A519B0|nr:MULTISPECIES: hypothetical protein [Bacillaceae]ELK48518.1 hypothetical protein D479_02842 [Halobacillus sp. BAB-2008]QHT47899.1 hypothetical protein M662_15885 [Bacillus sp. SB49]WJE15133.1 hypothetical protein QRD89_15620 [Halobacillus sp. ACCC02827]